MKLVAAFAFVVMTVAFTNCSNVKFSGTSSGSEGVVSSVPDSSTTPVASSTPDPSQPPASVAIANCAQAAANGKLSTLQKSIDFADTKVESGRSPICQWGQGDNLSQKDGYLRARYDQSLNLGLPANAVLCNITMTTNKQSFKYDDVFFLTFNNKIIASNLARAVTPLPFDRVKLADGKSVNMYDYAWVGGVRDANFQGVNDTADDYCLGAAEGHASCSWPLSQQAGNIQFSFDKELLINIGVLASAQNQSFGFTITGDNDPSSDCYHEDLTFQMSVQYYVK